MFFRVVSLVGVLGLTVILGACGGGASCSKACKHLTACDPGAPCPFSAQCSTVERCQAKCVSRATCDELKTNAATVASCTLQCGQVPPKKDLGQVSLDGGGPMPDLGCTPACSGKQCGPDGCGGECGACSGGTTCNTGTWQCVSSCTPSCTNKQCGDDGCGGSCGTCGGGTQCNFGTGKCEMSCTPSCSGKQCGNDGCGGSCGTCSGGTTCNTLGLCVSSSGSNSGALCSTTCTGGDLCVLMEQNATQGMCVATCANGGDPCPVNNSSTQLSFCGGQAGTNNICVYVCKAQGQTYSCPNAVDYKCVAPDPQQPDISLCMPK